MSVPRRVLYKRALRAARMQGVTDRQIVLTVAHFCEIGLPTPRELTRALAEHVFNHNPEETP